MEPVAINIGIYFDTICPWCFIGKRRLDAALAGRPGIRAGLVWRPFLLNSQMPPQGMDREEYMLRKFGSQSRMIRVETAMVEAGCQVGIEFDFTRIRRTPNTIDAHRLIRHAAGEGKADAAVESLFRAYFLEGRDTGRSDVLEDVGAEIGLERPAISRLLAGAEGRASVLDENARAHRSGINGVPTFVFDGNLVISGAQEPQVLSRMLDLARTATGASVGISLP